MRSRLALFAAALVGLSLSAAAPSEAGYRRAPVGYGNVQVVRHYGYYPRYQHVYAVDYRTDPYAYAPRGSYAYYNSGYWRPEMQVRYRGACCAGVIAYPRDYYGRFGYPYGAWAVQRWGRAYRPY